MQRDQGLTKNLAITNKSCTVWIKDWLVVEGLVGGCWWCCFADLVGVHLTSDRSRVCVAGADEGSLCQASWSRVKCRKCSRFRSSCRELREETKKTILKYRGGGQEECLLKTPCPDTSSCTGPVGMHLADHLYCDFTDDTNFESRLDELVRRILTR